MNPGPKLLNPYLGVGLFDAGVRNRCMERHSERVNLTATFVANTADYIN
jgi:hypothetical protein